MSHDLDDAVVGDYVVGVGCRAGQNRVGAQEGLTHAAVDLDVYVAEGDTRRCLLERLLVDRDIDDLTRLRVNLDLALDRERQASGDGAERRGRNAKAD